MRERARDIVATPDLNEKVALAYQTASDWFGRRLARGTGLVGTPMPKAPGRPEHVEMVAPSELPRRTRGRGQGRVALIHSLAHIELSAIDLTWDLVGRFVDEQVPRSFFDDFVQVGLEEAKHFAMISARLADLNAAYGDLPVHGGLWEAAEATADDLTARLALIPMVLEARGLDVTPGMAENLRLNGDEETAALIDIIYRDEKRHVAFGSKWFRFLCDRQRRAPEPTFHEIVRRCFRGALKPPFNDRARAEAGLTPGFYKPLARITG
nr:ferritin-like domain-containing protein [Oryzibacter oryziterrae]